MASLLAVVVCGTLVAYPLPAVSASPRPARSMVWEVLIDAPRAAVWEQVTSAAVARRLSTTIPQGLLVGAPIVVAADASARPLLATIVDVQRGTRLAAVVTGAPGVDGLAAALRGSEWTLALSAAGRHSTVVRLEARSYRQERELRRLLGPPILLALWRLRDWVPARIGAHLPEAAHHLSPQLLEPFNPGCRRARGRGSKVRRTAPP